jgi:hypothetical protein
LTALPQPEVERKIQLGQMQGPLAVDDNSVLLFLFFAQKPKPIINLAAMRDRTGRI